MNIFSQLVLTSFRRFNDRGGVQIAASLSFFTLFATGPILIILITLLGFFLTNEQTYDSIQIQLAHLTGMTHSSIFTDIYRSIIHHPIPGTVQYVVSFTVLLITSTTVIRYLQKSINTIWDIPPEKKLSLGKKIHKRILAVIFLVFLSLIILLSFVIGTFISFIEQYIGIDFTSFSIISDIFTFFVMTTLFFLIFKYFPDADIRANDVILGSTITGVLFLIGKYAISIYLGKANYTSIYGAAGSLIGFLAWIYYSYVIFLFGAAFTYVYAKTYGKGVHHLT